MCSNYTPIQPNRLHQYFGTDFPGAEFKAEAYPGYLAPIVRLADDQSGEKEAVAACFGMVPHWAELKLAKHTYNARTETVTQKPSFRTAVAKRQFCIVPAESFFEPNYETGKAVRWKIARGDGGPLGIAGIWDWRPNGGPDDRPLVSFSMLTINADDHPLMKRFHKPGDEKRMLVILEPEQYEPWLQAPVSKVPDFYIPYPADQLIAEPAPRPPRAKARHVDEEDEK